MPRYVWMTSAERLLIEEYPTKGAAWCAERLGLTPEQVRQHANHIGLRRTTAKGAPFSSGYDSRRGNGRRFEKAK